MQTLIIAVHVLVAIAIIVLVLLQHGKGADAGGFRQRISQHHVRQRWLDELFHETNRHISPNFLRNQFSFKYLASHQKNNNLQFLENISAPSDHSPSGAKYNVTKTSRTTS